MTLLITYKPSVCSKAVLEETPTTPPDALLGQHYTAGGSVVYCFQKISQVTEEDRLDAQGFILH